MSQEFSKPLLVFVVLLFIAVFVVIVSVQSDLPTANAVADVSGNITVIVNETISIYLNDSVINFGNCTLNQTRGYSYFDSSKDNTSSFGCDNFQCIGIYQASEDFFNLTNDGNVNVNVTLKANITAGSLYTVQGSSSNSYYQYKSTNSGLGCDWTTGNQPFTYVNISLANLEYQLCDNMSYIDGGDSFEIYAGIWINASVDNGGKATWTFTATAV